MISFIFWSIHCLIFGLCNYLMYKYKTLLDINNCWKYISLRLLSIMPLINVLFLLVLTAAICFCKCEKAIDKIVDKLFGSVN